MNTFAESQRFRQWWLWTLMGFSVLVFVGSLVAADALTDPASLLGFIPLLLTVLLLYVWRLDTRVDSEGIHYRVFPVLSWRTISWKAIKSATVCHYSFVGYGIRWGFEGWVYNIAGNKGLRVVFLNNRKITIGTQRPDELKQFLDQQNVLIAE